MSKLPDLSKISSYTRLQSGSSIAGRVLLGASALCALFGVTSFFQAFGAEKEIEYRKSQLRLPIYKLTE
jgi:hypothetical protein